MHVRVLDLFCGGGGSSWGAFQAGAEIACGIDAWETAVSVFNDNFSGCGVHATITAESDPRDVLSYGPFDMILASPECTNHTCARGSRPRDEKSRLTAKHVLNYLKYYRPRWAVIENVVHMKRWDKYQELVTSLKDIGYKVRTQTLNASLFGVPQSRSRLFILCDLFSEPKIIQPAASKPNCTARSILDPVGTWSRSKLYSPGRALATIKRAERALKDLPPGEDFLVVYYGSDAAGGWQSLDRPLRTLTTLDRFGLVEHTAEGLTLRMLQPPELKRAMGLNESFILDRGTRRDKIRLLGNGVCAPVMKRIVETMVADECSSLISTVRRRGPKRIMTENKIESAKRLLANGLPRREVAVSIGVSIPTLYRWVPANSST